MPAPLLNIFKYLLIVLIWLFFLRVLRAVWVESKGSSGSPMMVTTTTTTTQAPIAVNKPSKSKRRTSGQATAPGPKLLVVSGISPVPGQEFLVDGAITIGRGQGCSIPMLKDTFASSVHARVYKNADDLYVEDLDSTNGTFVNGKKVLGSQMIVSGDRIQIGQTIFEVSV
jgi:pSer/pThr/pTyr-binding forkhead associated (FHA) protein